MSSENCVLFPPKIGLKKGLKEVKYVKNGERYFSGGFL